VMFERTVFLRKMRGFLEQVLETQSVRMRSLNGYS
jgi:hypothetical protein